MSEKTNPIDFEQSLQQLESLVDAMENGELSLEESLQAFEKGIALTRACQTALEKAEQRVQLLLQKDGLPVEVPFEVEDNSEQ
jgi:exodeoxyribonuclease VII small subunit